MGYKIKEARERAGLSQAELAEKAGVSRSIINGLETGRASVTTTTTIARIATALGVSVDEIFFANSV